MNDVMNLRTDYKKMNKNDLEKAVPILFQPLLAKREDNVPQKNAGL